MAVYMDEGHLVCVYGMLIIERTVPGAFAASETFDVGTDLGLPVFLPSFDKAPSSFDGTIKDVRVELTDE